MYWGPTHSVAYRNPHVYPYLLQSSAASGPTEHDQTQSEKVDMSTELAVFCRLLGKSIAHLFVLSMQDCLGAFSHEAAAPEVFSCFRPLDLFFCFEGFRQLQRVPLDYSRLLIKFGSNFKVPLAACTHIHE